MNCKTDSVMNKKQTVKRLITLAICVLFIAGSLLSAASIFEYINHEHDHNGPDGSCATCVHLTTAESLLKLLSVALAGSMLNFRCFSTIRSVLKSINFVTGFFTLVHLKVRLNH